MLSSLKYRLPKISEGLVNCTSISSTIPLSAESLLPAMTSLSVSSSPLPDLLAALHLFDEQDRQQEERIQQINKKLELMSKL
jgi:hypothetical protein